MKNRFQDITMSSRARAETRLGFRLEHSDDAMTIYVHDVIGDPLEGLDSATLVPEIDKNKDRQVVLNINSGGGSVFDAISIYNALVLHGNVRADITGIAASAATILASAANHIRIATSGFYLIHRSTLAYFVFGNGDDIEKVSRDIVQSLRAVDADIADVLSARSGTSAKEIAEMMAGTEGSDGTRFTAREAVDLGFADELIPLQGKPEPEEEPEQDLVKRSYLDMVVAHRRRAA